MSAVYSMPNVLIYDQAMTGSRLFQEKPLTMSWKKSSSVMPAPIQGSMEDEDAAEMEDAPAAAADDEVMAFLLLGTCCL